MKKRGIQVIAVIVALSATTLDTAAISGTGNEEKYKNYIRIEDSHIFCGQSGYISEGSRYYGTFVKPEDDISNGQFTLINTAKHNDALLVKTAANITDTDIIEAVKALDEISVFDYSSYGFRIIEEGWNSNCDKMFYAPDMSTNATKELVSYLEKLEYIEASELYRDEFGEQFTIVFYPFHYHASPGERDETIERIRSRFPEYVVASSETNENDFYVSSPVDLTVNEKLTIADNIKQAEDIAPDAVIPEFGGETKATCIEAYYYINGDANCDDKLTVSDAVAVLQYIANAEKYPLSEQARFNADIDGEDGITGGDAIAIQKIDAGIL